MVLDRLKRRKQPEGPQLGRSEFLTMRPIRNPQITWVKSEDGRIRITIPLKQLKKEGKTTKIEGRKRRRKRESLFSKLTPDPKEKHIQLDVIGSIVWEFCDGENTVKEIVGHLHNEYKLLPSEAEISLNSYFNDLSKRGLLAFLLPGEMRPRSAEETRGRE